MDEALKTAIVLFNDGRYSEFQDAIDSVASQTRAPSERRFCTLLNHLAEALLQLSDGDVEDALAMVSAELRKLDEFMPRFRGINVEALREDFRRVLVELRDAKDGRRAEIAPSKLPRLRILAQ